MRLITWNIQCGKGCDGVTDLARIIAVAKEIADADVFCFQEVSSNFSNLDGGTDQGAELAQLLPDHLPSKSMARPMPPIITLSSSSWLIEQEDTAARALDYDGVVS